MTLPPVPSKSLMEANQENNNTTVHNRLMEVSTSTQSSGYSSMGTFNSLTVESCQFTYTNFCLLFSLFHRLFYITLNYFVIGPLQY